MAYSRTETGHCPGPHSTWVWCPCCGFPFSIIQTMNFSSIPFSDTAREKEPSYRRLPISLAKNRMRYRNFTSSLSLFSQGGKRGQGSVGDFHKAQSKRIQSGRGQRKFRENIPGSGPEAACGHLFIAGGLRRHRRQYRAAGQDRRQRLDFSLGFALSRSLLSPGKWILFPLRLFQRATRHTGILPTSWASTCRMRFGLDHAQFKTQKNHRSAEIFRYAFDFPLYSDPFFEQDFQPEERVHGSSVFAGYTNTTTIAKREHNDAEPAVLASLDRLSLFASSQPLFPSANLSKIAAQMTWKTKTQPTTGLTTAQKETSRRRPPEGVLLPRFPQTA